MDLEFLRDGERKIVRTALYNDQEFTTWELELLHTPVLQRLYNLKQLGFADRVFPDAVHSRLNHVLGVAEMAERMADRLVRWLEKHPSADFAYVDDTSSARQEWRTKSVTGADLAKHVRANISVIRLIGLLHDITHAAFGHTLEDEVCVFSEKHDDPLRQKRFFDALTAQLLYFWAVELGTQAPDADVLDSLVHLEIDATKARTWAEELREALGSEKSERLAVRLRELELACSLLSYIEFLHKTDQDAICLLYTSGGPAARDRPARSRERRGVREARPREGPRRRAADPRAQRRGPSRVPARSSQVGRGQAACGPPGGREARGPGAGGGCLLYTSLPHRCRLRIDGSPSNQKPSLLSSIDAG